MSFKFELALVHAEVGGEKPHHNVGCEWVGSPAPALQSVNLDSSATDAENLPVGTSVSIRQETEITPVILPEIIL